jgi:catechol 2,3-dioxygenase-like lactoylglutathione lyase family enzyme
MKTVFEHITRMVPVIRVNNRDLNLAFYTETLGLKVISEENAMAYLGGKLAKTRADARLILEESPSMRTRAVNGVKKLRKTVLSSPEFTASFEATSPEGDVFEIVPSQAVAVGDVAVAELQFNTPDIQKSLDFYIERFGLTPKDATFELPFGKLTYVAAEGEDLTTNPEGIWDLEIIEFEVPATVDLKTVAAQLEALNFGYFADKKGKVLAMKDPQNIELWLIK